MAKDDGLGEKTEEATPKRREEARDKGQVAQSKDLTSSISLLVAFSTIRMLGPWMGTELLGIFRWPMEHLYAFNGDLQDAVAGAVGGFYAMSVALLPILGVLLVLSVALPMMQVGLKITPKAFELKPDKMNPINGIKKIFSLRSVVKISVGIAKITLVSVVLLLFIFNALPEMIYFIGLFDARGNPSGPIVIYLFDSICWLGIYAGAVLSVFSVIDFIYQRWQHSQDLKMSKQEVKEEMKNLDGDPMIKRKRLERAREIAQRQMMDEVPEADVVVTNPTHYSVALRYRDEEVSPRVVAKGTDRRALRIREIASENRVPIVEKPELARALYRWVEIDELIPPKYWQPVAEVLAYVYEMDQKRKERAMGAETN